MIKDVIFDFGGVLMDWDPRYFYRIYFKDEEEMEYFLSNICTDDWNAEQDRGRPFEEGVRLLQAQYPQYAEPIQMFKDKWEYMLKGEFPESVDLLKQLKNKGYGIYGLTNWSAETIPLVYAKYDFFQLFDGIVVSGEEKVIKPDPKIYRILLERYNLTAENTLFIDDNSANIETAKRLGGQTIVFDSIENVSLQVSALINKNRGCKTTS